MDLGQHILENRVEIGKKILEAYELGKGIFKSFHSESTNDIGMEEDLYLNYITFVSSIDYKKGIKANKLWKDAKKWVKEKQWIFEPNNLLNKPVSEVIKCFNDIRQKHGGVFRVQDIGIWLKIADSLQEFGGSTKALLEKFDYDALRIYNEFNEKFKKKFPFLSGDKILPMWLKILWEAGEVKLKNINKIPLPVDTNVARVTYNLIFKEKFDGKVNREVIEKVRKVWNEIAKKLKKPVIVFDTPLWFLGGEGCSTLKCNECLEEFRSECYQYNSTE